MNGTAEMENGRTMTMKKLIELGVAIDIAIGAADEYDGGYNFERDRKIRDALMALPTVDAVPVRHGRWIWRIWWDYPEYQYQCDQCKRWAMFESKFCPNCGAKMDGKDGEQNG